MAYACPQHHPQQQGHCLQAQQPPAQHKEQDTVLKSIEHANDRIAQLEQRQKQQEEAIQGVSMQQYVTQQMEDWRTWAEKVKNFRKPTKSMRLCDPHHSNMNKASTHQSSRESALNPCGPGQSSRESNLSSNKY